MIGLLGTTPIYLCRTATDMRKSFDGLHALVVQHLEEDPFSGALFVFVNRRRTMVKVLYWDRDGFALWYKRLEQGTFKLPAAGGDKIELDAAQLSMLLEGITPRRINRRYRRAKNLEITPENPPIKLDF